MQLKYEPSDKLGRNRLDVRKNTFVVRVIEKRNQQRGNPKETDSVTTFNMPLINTIIQEDQCEDDPPAQHHEWYYVAGGAEII